MPAQSRDAPREDWEKAVQQAQGALRKGQYGVAEQCFLRALQLSEEAPPPTLTPTMREQGVEEVPDTRPVLIALTKEFLADLYNSWRRRPRAIELYQEVLSLREEHLGAKHHKLVGPHFDLATCHFADRDFERAEHHYKKAIEIGRSSLGPRSEGVGSVLHALGTLYALQERHAEARPVLQEACEVRSEADAENGFDLMATLTMLAETEKSLGNQESALRCYRRVLAVKEERLGVGHLGLISTLESLAHLHEEADQVEEALALWQRILALQQEHLSHEPKHLVASNRNVGRLQVHLDLYPDAVKSYEAVVEVLSQVLGKDHPELLEDLDYLVELYDYLDREDEARTAQARAEKIRRKHS